MAQETVNKVGAVNKVVVVVPDNSGYLNVLRQAVGSTASLMGFDAVTVLQLQMAIDEACSNVIEHGQGADRPPAIRLKLDALPCKLVMHVQDHCSRFSPLEKDVQTLDQYFESSKTKGLGLVIMHQFVDEIRHSYRSDTGNRLSLTKFLPAGPKSPAGPA
ncbi:MAG: ATP-binding protein [Planctomycetes bacterium]|nr:ATP-binding protein [Planctomycetota bacterium]